MTVEGTIYDELYGEIPPVPDKLTPLQEQAHKANREERVRWQMARRIVMDLVTEMPGIRSLEVLHKAKAAQRELRHEFPGRFPTPFQVLVDLRDTGHIVQDPPHRMISTLRPAMQEELPFDNRGEIL